MKERNEDRRRQKDKEERRRWITQREVPGNKVGRRWRRETELRGTVKGRVSLGAVLNGEGGKN